LPESGYFNVSITEQGTGAITISHIPVRSAEVNQSIDIYANITSTLPLTDVKVYYIPVGSNTSLVIAMTLIAGNNTNGTWYAQIPAQDTPGTLYYHIWATDGNNTATAPETGNYGVTITPVSEISNYGTLVIAGVCIGAVIAGALFRRKH
jgi:hypothetical protein